MSRIPKIAPVLDQIHRPQWSVMIPTYNCARFLEKTLTSVLKQAPSVDDMEIIVVDDVSLKDDPEDVVARAGRGRVHFHRNQVNLGATRNFNNCINLSSGKFIHILHGDDFVDDGFYDEISSLFRLHPDCSLAATRTVAIDENEIPLWLSQRTRELETGGNNLNPFFNNNQLQTPSVVISRSFYEQFGGFDEELLHVADWEMWVRAIGKGKGIVSPMALARYRIFDGNETSDLVQSGDNIRAELKLLDIFSQYDEFDRKSFCRKRARKAAAQARQFRKVGNAEAYQNNVNVYRELRSPIVWFQSWWRMFLVAI